MRKDEIVRVIEELLEKEDDLESLLNTSYLTDNLKKSILAKAFRGEFSSNDLKEDSSIDLLKEIIE